MASSTTRTPRTPAAWTASGACTSGSTAPPGDATTRASGGAATTSTTGAERVGRLAAASGATRGEHAIRLPAPRARPEVGREHLALLHRHEGQEGLLHAHARLEHV